MINIICGKMFDLKVNYGDEGVLWNKSGGRIFI